MISQILIIALSVAIENFANILKIAMTAMLIRIIVSQRTTNRRIVGLYENFLELGDSLNNKLEATNRDVKLTINNAKLDLLTQYENRSKVLENQYTRIVTEFARLLEQRKIDRKYYEEFHLKLSKVNNELNESRTDKLTSDFSAVIENFRHKVDAFHAVLDTISNDSKDTKFKVNNLLSTHIKLIDHHLNYLVSGEEKHMESALRLLEKIKSFIQ